LNTKHHAPSFTLLAETDDRHRKGSRIALKVRHARDMRGQGPKHNVYAKLNMSSVPK